MPDPLSPSLRRERVRQYKQAFPPMGVYAVRNLATGRAWLGASRNVDGALNRIRFELQQGGHRDRELAGEWARFGASQFSFEVLERLRQREDPAFDYEAELQESLALWRAELDARQGTAP